MTTTVDRPKIANIREAKTGMAHLIEQANQRPQTQPREQSSDLPPNKCLKIRVILDATDYYAPLGGFGMNQEPPFQFRLPVAYSEVRVNNTVLSILRHELLEIYATGLKSEVVDLPEWWSRRDEGVI